MNAGFERTKMDVEARSKAKRDQMTGKVCLNKELTTCSYQSILFQFYSKLAAILLSFCLLAN